ncbi:FHA domain-containing protein [soil metagenome]
MTDGGLILTHLAGEVRLPPGRSLTFGRTRASQDGPGLDGGPDDAHLGLSPSGRVHAVAGSVEALDDGWLLVNQGRWLQVRVVRLDGPERTDVAPGRTLRVPWPSVRVELATGEEEVGFQVDCPALDLAGPEAAPIAGDTVRGLDLDRTAGYFRALVALCEPRLRDASSTDVATVAQVARTLSLLPSEPERVTVKAVERRLAHARRRVAIGGDPDGVSAAGLEVRDASHQLVDLLLRTGTVTAADLALIEGPTAGPGPDQP